MGLVYTASSSGQADLGSCVNRHNSDAERSLQQMCHKKAVVRTNLLAKGINRLPNIYTTWKVNISDSHLFDIYYISGLARGVSDGVTSGTRQSPSETQT